MRLWEHWASLLAPLLISVITRQLQLGSCRHIQGGEKNMQFHFYFSVFHTLDSMHLIIKIDIEYFSQSYRK